MSYYNKLTKKIIIGCTGSVATVKLPLLIKMLLDFECPVKFVIKIVVTERAKHFFDSKDIPLGVEIFNDEDEWKMWTKRGDPVLHIDLGKWADAFIVAPLDANSLAKFASGICDNLLMCTARAWDSSKPLLFCPAMNTRMYNHPVTGEQIEKLKNWGYIEIPCISKELMCGDTGIGAMAEVQTIYQHILECFIPPPPPSPHLLAKASNKLVSLKKIKIDDINDEETEKSNLQQGENYPENDNENEADVEADDEGDEEDENDQQLEKNKNNNASFKQQQTQFPSQISIGSPSTGSPSIGSPEKSMEQPPPTTQ